MNTNIHLYIGGILGAVIIALFVAVNMFWPNGEAARDTPADLPTMPTEGGGELNNQSGGGETFPVRIPGGRSIAIRDPRTLPNVTDFGSGLYHITDIDTTTGQPFSITFNENNGSFAVSLNEEPIDAARLAAEEYLLATLRVTMAELCQLPIFISTPYLVNRFFAGENVGISFCPGSMVLE